MTTRSQLMKQDRKMELCHLQWHFDRHCHPLWTFAILARILTDIDIIDNFIVGSSWHFSALHGISAPSSEWHLTCIIIVRQRRVVTGFRGKRLTRHIDVRRRLEPSPQCHLSKRNGNGKPHRFDARSFVVNSPFNVAPPITNT
jgi:hypothetical protein